VLVLVLALAFIGTLVEVPLALMSVIAAAKIATAPA
jgi:hypothetical protein